MSANLVSNQDILLAAGALDRLNTKNLAAMHRLEAVLSLPIYDIAREIALDIYPLDQILASRGLSTTDPRWERMRTLPEFTRALAQHAAEWNSVDSTRKRIQYKAQAALEASIPSVFALVTDTREKGTDRVKGFEALARISGAVQPEGAGGRGGPGFSVNVNIMARDGSTRSVRILDGESEATAPRQAAPVSGELGALDEFEQRVDDFVRASIDVSALEGGSV